MPESSLYVRLLHGDDAFPPTDSPFFQEPRTGDIFHSHAWLENFCRHGVPPGDRFRLYAVERQPDRAPLALIPAVYSRLYGAHPRARVLHFLQPEALERLLIPPKHGQSPLAALESVIGFLGVSRPAHDVLRFSPMRPGTALSAGLISILRRNGYAVQIYHLPHEYYEPVAGRSSRDYLAARSHALHKAADHADAALSAGERVSFRLISKVEDVDAGWRDYQKILEANESDPEPESPNYLPNAMRVAAEFGALRLGFIDLEGEPVAVQLWIVSAGIARCLRIWSAFRHQALALDDMLTERLAVHLIDIDRVSELSFGAMNDPFITNWAPAAREQFGLAAFNLHTWRGIKGTARHVCVGMIRSLLAGRA